MGAGAFFGPLAALSGLAANSRSQGQRQAQLDAIEKLKQQGLIQEQQAKSQDMQNAAQQRIARDKWLNDPNTDPQMAAMVKANLPADVINSYKQNKKDQALAALNIGVMRIAKGDKATAMKLAQDAALAGISEAEIKSAFSGTEFFRDPETEESKALRLIAQQNQIALQQQKLATDAAKPKTASSKFLDAPLGSLKGMTFLRPDGTPFENPAMTVGDAINEGGIELTDKNATQLQNATTTQENLNGLLATGQKVLPPAAGIGAATTSKAYRFYLKETGDPDVNDFEHSKAAVIGYLRNLTGVGRVNQTELSLVVDRIDNANSYPALQSAISRAQKIIEQDKQGLVRAGKLKVGSYAGGAVGAPLEGSGGSDGTTGTFTPGGLAPPPPPGFK